METPNPQCIVCFPVKYTNMIPEENKRRLVHPTGPGISSSWLHLRGWDRVAPGAAPAALDAEDGRREGGREREEGKNLKKGFFFHV